MSAVAQAEVIYNMGADEIDIAAGPVVIYQGSHGDKGAHIADIILPAAAYTEEEGLYVNTEGRVQMGMAATPPKGDAKEGWAIIRALSAHLNRVLPYDSLDALREALFADHPSFAGLDHAPEGLTLDLSSLGSTGKMSAAPLTNAVSEFYFTNPIARASEVMAECAAVSEAAELPKEAAE
jgi:NADH-quinone oxidoreductase subunit G